VLQACCQRLPAGAAVEEVEALAAAVLDPAAGVAVRLLDPDTATTGDVIRRSDGRLVPVRACQEFCVRGSDVLTGGGVRGR